MFFTPLLQGGVSSGNTRTLVCVNNIAKRTTQPQTTPQISNYWKSRGFKWVVNGTEPRELVSGITLDPTAGATTEVNHSGKALANRSTGVGWTKSITSSPAKEATLVWFGDFYASTIGNPFVAGVLPNLTDGGPYSNVALIRNRTGAGTGSIGYFYADTPGNVTFVSSPYSDYNEAKNLGIVAKIKDGSQKLFTNKRGLELTTTTALVGGGLYTATPILTIGSGNPTRTADASCSFFAVSDQFLTDAECLSLAKNPWQIFKPATKPIYVAAKSLTRRSVPVLRRIRKTQPQTPTKINWSNPLTQGLVVAINPAAPDPQLIRVGTPTYLPTPYGVALKNPNDTTVNGLTKTVKTMGSAATIVAYCTIPENATTAFLVGGFGTNGAGNQLFAFQGSLPTGGVGAQVRAVIRTVDGGGLSSAEAGTYQPIWGTELAVWIGVYDGTGALTIYRNGVDITASRFTGSASGSISTLDNFSLGFINRGTDASSGPNTQNLLGLGFNRALSPQEVYALSKNPWQIFKSVDKPIYLSSVPRPRSFVRVKTKPQIKQPQKSTKINWSNPITKGLVKAVNAAVSDPTVTLLGTSPTPLKVTSPVGIGYSANGATSYWQASPTALASLNPTWTILAIVSNFTGITNGGGYGLYVERPNSTQIVKIVAGQNESFSTAEFTCRDLTGNLIQMRPSYGSGGGPNVADGKPHVMVFTRRASNNHRGWIDGVERVFNTTTNINGAFGATNATIGRDPFDSVTFNGSIPLVMVWNRSLSDKELLSISQNPWQVFKAPNDALYLEQPPSTIVSNGLVIHLDAANPNSYSGTGTTWSDLSGSGNIGTLTNGPSYTADNSGAVVFDGIDDHVQITGNASNTPASMTLFCFIYPQNTRPEEIIATQNFGNGYRLMTKIYSGDNPSNRWGFRPSSGGTEYQSPTLLSNNNWYCLAVTYTPSSVSGYVNGVLDWTVANPDALVHGGNIHLGDGIGGAQRHFQGKLPVFMMYNRALSAQEVLQNYNALAPRYATTTQTTLTTLLAPLFAGVNNLYNHTVSSFRVLLASLYTNTSTLYNGSVSSIRVLLASLYSNSSSLYNHTVDIWQNSVINYLSNLRTKVVTATTKAITAVSTTRTKVIEAGIKTLSVLSATRTKLFSPTAKSVSLVSDSRTKLFTPETKSKTFTTTTRG